MTDTSNPAAGGRSIPDDVTAKAGLPRAEGIEPSLHAGPGPNAGAQDGALAAARARLGDGPAGEPQAPPVVETAETAAREAANAEAKLGARVSEAAGAARDRLGESVERARGRATDAYDDVRSWAADRYDAQSRRAAALADRGYGRLREGRTATEAFVSDNPLLVGVVGLAAGLLLGALLPRTRREDEAIGPWADEVRDQGLRYAREMTHRGRAFVETALDPDNLDNAVRRAAEDEEHDYEGAERKAHRL